MENIAHRLAKEIKECKEILEKSGNTCTIKIVPDYISIDNNYEDILKKCDLITCSSSSNSNSERYYFEFNSNGRISLYKTKDHNQKYRVRYSLLTDFLKLTSESNSEIKVDIDSNSFFTSIVLNNYKIIIDNKANSKEINYFSDDKKISIQIVLNNEDKIEKCYIDFRTFKESTQKVNGVFALRLYPKYNERTLRILYRSGMVSFDLLENILKKDIELYDLLINQELTVQCINNLIIRMIPLLNELAEKYNRPTIKDNLEDKFDLNKPANDVVSYLTDIKDEIPSSHLQMLIQNIIDRTPTSQINGYFLNRKQK